jgi:hypothetical protein
MIDPYILGLACDGDCRQDGCPKCGYVLGIGDPIEIRSLQRSPFKYAVEEIWLPATITHVSEAEIGVAFSDGERLAIPRRSGGLKQWRTGRHDR